jgi:hypothetical protein
MAITDGQIFDGVYLKGESKIVTYRSSNKPINILDVEDLLKDTSNHGVRASKLDRDGGVAQV